MLPVLFIFVRSTSLTLAADGLPVSIMTPPTNVNTRHSDRGEVIVSWQGATVTLSRDRATSSNLPIRNVPNPPSLGGDEMTTPESLEGDILEPLLPPGLVGVSSEEEKDQGVGEDGTPVFSLKDVFLTVRRGEVRLAAAYYSSRYPTR